MWNILFIIKSICLSISIWFFEKLFLFETCNSRNRDFDESRLYVNLVKSFQVFLRRGHTFLKQFGNFYRYFSTNKARFAFWTWKTISIRPRIVIFASYSLDISCTLSSADLWSRRTSDNERIGVGCNKENVCEWRSEKLQQKYNVFVYTMLLNWFTMILLYFTLFKI